MSLDAHCFRVGAARLRDAALEAERLADTLEQLADGPWEGCSSAIALRGTAEDQVAQLRQVAAGHRIAASCLTRHAAAADAGALDEITVVAPRRPLDDDLSAHADIRAVEQPAPGIRAVEQPASGIRVVE